MKEKEPIAKLNLKEKRLGLFKQKKSKTIKKSKKNGKNKL